MWKLVSVGVIAFVFSLLITPGGSLGTTGARAAVTPTLSTTASPGGPVNTTTLHDTATVTGTAGAGFTCPPQDQAGFAVGQKDESSDPIFCSYPAVPGEDPNDFFCTYSHSSGALVTDNDAGFCPASAVSSGGGTTPTGTVTFNTYGPNDATCTGASVFTSTKTLSGGTASSDFFTPAAPGVYRWTVSYSGDSNFSALSAVCNGVNESATITAAALPTPTLSTTASAGGPLGTSLHDTATVAGAGSGFACPSQDQSGFPLGQSNVASDPIFCSYPAVVGEDPNDFFCTYSHSTGALVTDNDAGFCPATAVGSAGTTPTGTVTFKLYGPNDATCSGSAVFTSSPITLSGGTASSGNTTPVAAGVYRWTASYSGDSNYSAVPAACNGANESATITGVLATPTIGTTASAGGAVGTSVSDTATVSGGNSPTGNVTFKLFSNSSCATQVFTSTNSLAGSSATSGSFTPGLAGTYYWTAVYNGDANNNSATSPCLASNESVTITPAALPTPTLSTTASAGGPVGTALHDTATVAGAGSVFTCPPQDQAGFAIGQKDESSDPIFCSYPAVAGEDPNDFFCTYSHSTGALVTDNDAGFCPATAVGSAGTTPTGTVTFKLYGPNDATCSGSAVFTSSPITLSGGTASSGNTTPVAAGVYRWTASYSGDSNYSAVPAACNGANESATLTAVLTTPTISTAAGGTVVLGSGSKLTDTATLGGGSSPTGTITFTLKNPSSVVVYTDVVTVSGNGSYTTATGNNPGGYLPTVAGTYLWSAAYSGDGNNNSATDNGQNENESVSLAAPAVSTQASAGGPIGTVVNDTATLSGGTSPTGTITFTLKNPSNVVVYTDVVTVSGNGPYSTAAGNNPGGYTTTVAGTYVWTAAYSGDANNSPATDNGQNESVVIGKASPTISTQASQGGPIGAPGTLIHDTATVSGGNSPTGTVTFNLYSDSSCTTQVFTSTNPLAGGSATSGDYFPAIGTYYWTATYNGDANNNAVTSPCGAPGESVTVGDVCAAILRLIGWQNPPVGCPATNRPPQRGGH